MNRKHRRAYLKTASKVVLSAPTKSAPVHKLFDDALLNHQAGRLGEAERCYREILAIDAHHSDALHLLGVLAHQVGENDKAVELIDAAIGINQSVPGYHCNRGVALLTLGRLNDAVAAYDVALRLKADYAEAHSNRGNALKDLGRFEEALGSCNAAIIVRPDLAEAYSNRGNALQYLVRYKEALIACTTATRLYPGAAAAHYNRGNALLHLGRHEEALAAFDVAIRLKRDYADAHANRGVVLGKLGFLEAALASYDTAIRLTPNHIGALLSRGHALMELGRMDEALAAYNFVIDLKPNYASAYSNRLLALHYQAADARGSILTAARQFGAQFDRAGPDEVSVGEADPERRLRIGYVSGDFRRHPVGYFLAPVLTNHDRSKVELFCYSAFHGGDDITEYLRASSDHWRSLVGLNDEAAANLVRCDKIDILIDLSGHTDHNRLPMFALRAAPVQVSWLGYFGTTGLAAMDYVLADRFVVPDDENGNFTESIWRLPDSYLCFSPPDFEVAIEPATKAKTITFGNFNNYSKSSSYAITLWSRILARVPDSRLLLKTKALGDENVRRKVLRRFSEYGVGAERLQLEGAAPRADLLAAYNRIDIALDPTPYGGGTTTAEALWMGVPTVTLRGGSWVGRVSESILSTVGLPDLVATTPEEYVEIAAQLAADLPRRVSLRLNLRTMLEESPLCRGAGFTRNLEAALRAMWRNRC